MSHVLSCVEQTPVSLQLMSGRTKVVVYLPSLRAAVRHFRAFSSYDERHPSDETFSVESDTVIGGVYIHH